MTMQNRMRIGWMILCVVVTLFGSTGRVAGQTPADAELGAVLNAGDLWLLRERYPVLKDSVSMEMLQLIAEAQLGVGFNRLEEAEAVLDVLLRKYQEEMGPTTTLNMAAVRAFNLLNLGHYAAAGEIGAQLVAALEGSQAPEAISGLRFIERVGQGLADVPAPYLERPDRDVQVPMKVIATGRGHHLHIPVEVNGVTRDFIFDTGCSFGNFVTEEYAREVGLRIVADSIPVAGAQVGLVKLATADSLRIGDLVYHHPVFMVAPPDPELDESLAYDGVLGFNFMRAAQEIVLDVEKGMFVFPAAVGTGTPNMVLASNVPYVRIRYDGEPFDLLFDSGNVKTDLGTDFARSFPKAVAGLPECHIQRGGFGGMVDLRAVTLPEWTFTLAGVSVTLHDTDVYETDQTLSFYSGSLGCDCILAFRRLTLNYAHMYLRGER